jgi:hypothetical protein
MGEKVYLGDSVYAEFNTMMAGDVTLTTQNGYGPTNTIYLEPQIVENMQLMRQQAAMRAAHLRCLENEGTNA